MKHLVELFIEARQSNTFAFGCPFFKQDSIEPSGAYLCCFYPDGTGFYHYWSAFVIDSDYSRHELDEDNASEFFGTLSECLNAFHIEMSVFSHPISQYHI